MRNRFIALSAIVLAVATGAVFFLRENAGENAVSFVVPVVRSVRLANRTITVVQNEGALPTVPAMPPHLSRRGTASFIVVAREKATLPVRRRIESCGARVMGLVAPYGIVVEADAGAVKRIAAVSSFLAIEGLSPEDRIASSLKRTVAECSDDVLVTVVPLSKDDSAVIESVLVSKGARIVRTCGSDFGSVRAEMSPHLVKEFSERADVRRLEHFFPPKLLTDIAVRPGLLNVTPIHETYALTGKGQYITISDTGLDTGNASTVMDDFKGRIGFLSKTETSCLGYDQVGHGTHVAGIAVGNGALSGGWFKGVAYEAKLNFYSCCNAKNEFLNINPRVIFAMDRSHPSYIFSGSWGGGYASDYSSFSAEFDDYLWRHPNILAVFAAGNYGTDYMILEPAGAKNVLAVGATESLRPYNLPVLNPKDPYAYAGAACDNPTQVASFSSRGPMVDGRIKPDVCAPGSHVVSTRSSCSSGVAFGLYPGLERYYMFDNGTSMATPFVSGCAAIVRQWLTERRGINNPSAALMKAILAGGAYDMSLASGADCGGAAPNSTQGWGRVDLGQSLYPTNASVMLVDGIAFSDGIPRSFDVTITNRSPLSVQLVWTDYPAALESANTLVNDLDLVVSNKTTGAVWYGNGVVGGDRINTVESVRLATNEVEPGKYCIIVKGESVLYSGSTGAGAALYVRGAFSECVTDSWDGNTRTEFGIRSFMVLSSNKNYRWKRSETKVPKGQTLHFSVPESVPGGSDTIDIASCGDYVYSDENGSEKQMKVQKLGRIEIAESGAESGVPVTNAAGHMATSFPVVADRDKDVIFRFYDEASTNADTTLPMWWYRRYVETDPFADVVRFVSVSPERLEWIGGAGARCTIEQSPTLCIDSKWRAVYERLPAPVLTNAWEIPVEYSTNSFFRIR